MKSALRILAASVPLAQGTDEVHALLQQKAQMRAGINTISSDPAVPENFVTCVGCPTRGGCKAATSAATRAHVQCCDMFGSPCQRKFDGQCVKDKSYTEAVEFCASQGMRLCNVEEVSNCCGKGCYGDFGPMWTDKQAATPARNADAYVCNALPLNTWVPADWETSATSAQACCDDCRKQAGCVAWSFLDNDCNLAQEGYTAGARGGSVAGFLNTDKSSDTTLALMPSPAPPNSNCLERVNHHRTRYDIEHIKELWHMHPCANNQSVYDKEHGAHKSFGKCVTNGAQGTGGGSRCQDALDGFHNERLSCFNRASGNAGLGQSVASFQDSNKRDCTQKCNDDTRCKSFVVDGTSCTLYAHQDLPYDIAMNADANKKCQATHKQNTFIGSWYGGYDLGNEAAASPEECCSQCGAKEKCKWWTYEAGKCYFRSRLNTNFKAKSGAVTGSPYVSAYDGPVACDMGGPEACHGHCGPIAGSVESPHEFMSWGEHKGLFTLNWHRTNPNPWCEHDWCVFTGDYETTTTTTTTTMSHGIQACKGCPSRGGCQNAALDETHNVRCCAQDGSSCDDVDCQGGKTHKEASDICKSVGKRLCKSTELGKCCGTGCHFDFGTIWVQDPAAL